MDNLTHTLVGIALSRAFFQGKVRHATGALIFAANAPDLDLIAGFSGIDYLAYHRGVTHSIFALPLWAVLVAAALRIGTRHKRSPTILARWGSQAVPSWPSGMLIGLVGAGSHILLDWTNSFGIRLLSPISGHWFAGGFEFIVDPWLWLLLLMLLIVPMLLRLVSTEIGEREQPRSRYRNSAIAALLLVVLWWGFRAYWRVQSLEAMSSRLFAGHIPQSLDVFPTAGDPFRWSLVVDLPDEYIQATVNAIRGDIDGSFPQQTLYKPPPSSAIHVAETTRTARIFLGFARYPLAEVEQNATDTQVFFTDLRFKGAQEPAEMGALIVLGPPLNVLSERFVWQRERTSKVAP